MKVFGCVEGWAGVTRCQQMIVGTRRMSRASSETRQWSLPSCCWRSLRCCSVSSSASFSCSHEEAAALPVLLQLISSVHRWLSDSDRLFFSFALCSTTVLQEALVSPFYRLPSSCGLVEILTFLPTWPRCAVFSLYSSLSDRFNCQLHFCCHWFLCLLPLPLFYAAALVSYFLCVG